MVWISGDKQNYKFTMLRIVKLKARLHGEMRAFYLQHDWSKDDLGWRIDFNVLILFDLKKNSDLS